MKKIVLSALMAIGLAQAAHASPITDNLEVFGGYKTANIGGEDLRLNGVELGAVKTLTSQGAVYGKIQRIEKDKPDAKFTSGDVGYQHKFNQSGDFDVLGRLGVGYGKFDLKRDNLDQKSDVLTLPVSIELSKKVANNVSVYGNVGYELLHVMDTDTKCAAEVSQAACNAINKATQSDDHDNFTTGLGLKYAF